MGRHKKLLLTNEVASVGSGDNLALKYCDVIQLRIPWSIVVTIFSYVWWIRTAHDNHILTWWAKRRVEKVRRQSSASACFVMSWTACSTVTIVFIQLSDQFLGVFLTYRGIFVNNLVCILLLRWGWLKYVSVLPRGWTLWYIDVTGLATITILHPLRHEWLKNVSVRRRGYNNYYCFLIPATFVGLRGWLIVPAWVSWLPTLLRATR